VRPTVQHPTSRTASPLEAVAAALGTSSAMGPMNRELGPRLKAAIAASAELQERDALKSVGLPAAMTNALKARGVPDPIAQLASEMGGDLPLSVPLPLQHLQDRRVLAAHRASACASPGFTYGMGFVRPSMSMASSTMGSA
jgi:hypothetical protein